jgi:hypothetical protein
MKRLTAFIVICVFLSCESKVLNDTAISPSPTDKVKPAPDDTAAEDTVPGLKKIYEDAVKRFEDNTMGEIANCESICTAINTKWELNIQSVTGTEQETADMKYLLEMVDLANSMLGHATNYGTGSYATDLSADTIAVNECVNTLISPADNGRFVAVTPDSTAVVYSEDGGATWTATATPSSNGWRSVSYGDDKGFVAVENVGTQVAYSTNGINWTKRSTPLSASWSCVAYGGGKFVAVDSDGADAVYSDDGLNWAAAALPSSASWRSVTYGSGKFVAVANAGSKAAYSTNGVTWTEATLPTSGYWISVSYGNGKFVAVTQGGGNAAYSEDGINWTAATLPTSGYWSSVICGDGKFVAAAYNSNTAAYSEDGINWTAATLPASAGWTSVTYGKVNNLTGEDQSS